MPPPNYFAPEASATAVEKAHSSLRARLRSEDIPAPQGPANPTIDPQKHIYAKLQAIFSQDSYGQADSDACPKSSNLAGIPISLPPILSTSCSQAPIHTSLCDTLQTSSLSTAKTSIISPSGPSKPPTKTLQPRYPPSTPRQRTHPLTRRTCTITSRILSRRHSASLRIFPARA